MNGWLVDFTLELKTCQTNNISLVEWLNGWMVMVDFTLKSKTCQNNNISLVEWMNGWFHIKVKNMSD